jgi:hypothetical protein
MVADGMLTRKRYREVPPRVDYELTERARQLAPILGELARWGYEWAWGPPRGSEKVDIGAIFRLAPGLVEPAGVDATVEFVVRDEAHDGQSTCYSFTVAGDHLTLTEQPSSNPDARVRGDLDAWVRAFSPDRDRSRLAIEGNSELAQQLLDGLALSPSGRAAAAAQAAA